MRRSIRCRDAAGAGAFLAILLLVSGSGPVSAATPIGAAPADYLMRCGGCHGIEGVSVPRAIPDLRDHVGIFAATAIGRFYMLHLPNVAMSRLDDARLAAVLNFVVFGLGGRSIVPGTAPFTAAEVHAAIASGQIPDDLPGLRASAVASGARLPGAAGREGAASYASASGLSASAASAQGAP